MGEQQSRINAHSEQKLSLHELVEVVQSSHYPVMSQARSREEMRPTITIRSTIADDQVGQVALEVLDNLLGGASLGDVSFDLDHTRQGGL